MKSDLSIVIPTWNGIALLQRFLPSVIEAARVYADKSTAKIEILLVDDGSTDETFDWLSEQKTLTSIDLRILKNERNMGFSLTCNKGVEAARYPLIFLLNNDVEPDTEAIAPLVENFANQSVFAVHCRTFELDTGIECGTGKLGNFKRGFIRVHQSYTVASSRSKRVEANEPLAASNQVLVRPLYSMFAGGGAAMFDREKFISMGGFEHLLSPYYWEDVELSYRAWKRGFIILYEPRSIVRHRISSTISKLNQSKVRLIEQRNRIIYHWIHLHDVQLLTSHILWLTVLGLTAPLRLKPLFILACIEALKRLPDIQKRRQQEKAAAQCSDQQIFNIFQQFNRRSDIAVYDKKLESPTD
jgi:GT2 family glycosyltransferase